MAELDDLLRQFTDRINELASRVDDLERQEIAVKWRGTKDADFTLSELSAAGDYGYQTTAEQVQMNVDGTIRKIATL
jgi:hypothetical protein